MSAACGSGAATAVPPHRPRSVPLSRAQTTIDGSASHMLMPAPTTSARAHVSQATHTFEMPSPSRSVGEPMAAAPATNTASAMQTGVCTLI
jgi:hypothetical protein